MQTVEWIVNSQNDDKLRPFITEVVADPTCRDLAKRAARHNLVDAIGVVRRKEA